jgi:hypothetical protein
MPKYVIERDMPNAGKLTSNELKEIAQSWCTGINNFNNNKLQWIQSYVTTDKIYCVYIAPNKEMIIEHAKRGGFPANNVSEVSTIIDATTAE